MAELDLDEMFHLAIHASGKGDHERAIILLKQGAEKENSARFHYLLGTEHAEIGMLERAITDLERALSLDPLIAEAHFQLGLLHAMQGNQERASQAWEALDDFPDKAHLMCFKSAIEEYFSRNVEIAISKLQEGIILNKNNPALNKDMSNLVELWQKAATAPAEEKEETETAGSHLFLSAYKDRH